MELRVGALLTFSEDGNERHNFQNYNIKTTIGYEGKTYRFVPFGFSGVTVNRTGDNTEATLVFPNNSLARSWAIEAIEKRWIGYVQVLLFNEEHQATTRLHGYTGKISGGTWDETSLQIVLDTVLDAVGNDIPTRRLTQKLIGNIPVTSNVRLQ